MVVLVAVGVPPLSSLSTALPADGSPRLSLFAATSLRLIQPARSKSYYFSAVYVDDISRIPEGSDSDFGARSRRAISHDADSFPARSYTMKNLI